MKMHSRIQAEIDLDAMTYNLEHIKKNLAPKTQVIAVLKADGYGHGAVPLARRIQKDPEIWGIAVATVEEGEELRNAGITKPILILGYTYQEDYQKIAKLDFRPAVFKLSMAKELSKAALEAGKTLKIHIKIDTGMTRIGYRDVKKDVPEILEISKLPGLDIEGIFTHFARADEADKTPALVQYEKFQEFIRALEQEGLHIPMKHCSNSAGIIRMQEANLDAVRAGIILYGLYPSKEVEREPVPLKPLMSLRSHIAYIKTVEPGAEISYGGIFTTVRETRVATIPVGYADGLDRHLSCGKGSFMVNGHRVPTIGNICMDMTMLDVTGDVDADAIAAIDGVVKVRVL